MKRFLKILGIIFGSLLLIFLAFLGNVWYHSNQPKYVLQKAEVEEIYLFEDDKYLAVKLSDNWSNPLDFALGSRYFVTYDLWMRNPSSDTLKEYKEEYLHLHVYDLDQNLKQKTIDLIPILKQKGYDINRYEIRVGRIYVLDGKDYIYIPVFRRGDESRNREEFLINLETEELVELPPVEELKNQYPTVLNDAIPNSTLFDTVYDKYGVEINWTSPQKEIASEAGDIKNKKTNLTNSHFKEEYPKVAEMLENSKSSFVLARQEVVSDETYFNTLLEWFAPVGAEKLDLVIKKYGTDVQIPIKSYSDFIEYRKIYPKKESKDVTKED